LVWHFEVAFAYNEWHFENVLVLTEALKQPRAGETAARAWPTRNDPFSTFCGSERKDIAGKYELRDRF
jgi:hypothetical protein